MATYPTKLIEAFASQALQIYYMRSVAEAITNCDYEGEIKEKGSILNVFTFGALTAENYTGADMAAQDLTESNAQLITDQKKYFYFKVKDWDTFRSYIKNPENTIVAQVANEIKKVIDTFILGFHGDVAAGNRVGTDYTTGTVTVDVTTGAVTGSGTTFATGMVGKGFKALGHTSWYRVKTYTSTTAIIIEDDLDDEASAYTGGAISAGATYEVQANTAHQVDKDDVFAKVTDMATILTNNEIPQEDRWLVVPARIAAFIRLAPEYVGVGSEGGRADVQNGRLPGQFAGFNVYEVSDGRISGNATDGYHCLGGHRSAICMAMGLVRNQVEQDLIANFGKAYKSLYVYGAKVPDVRRKALVEGFFRI